MSNMVCEQVRFAWRAYTASVQRLNYIFLFVLASTTGYYTASLRRVMLHAAGV